jgi:hypothetical protein
LTAAEISVECAPLLQRQAKAAVEGEAVKAVRSQVFSERISSEELDGSKEAVHNLASVLQTDFVFGAAGNAL